MRDFSEKLKKRMMSRLLKKVFFGLEIELLIPEDLRGADRMTMGDMADFWGEATQQFNRSRTIGGTRLTDQVSELLKNTLQELFSFLRKRRFTITGGKYHANTRATTFGRRGVRFETDGSLIRFFHVEIILPPLQIDEILDLVPRMMKILNKLKVRTSSPAGMHIHVGLEDREVVDAGKDRFVSRMRENPFFYLANLVHSLETFPFEIGAKKRAKGKHSMSLANYFVRDFSRGLKRPFYVVKWRGLVREALERLSGDFDEKRAYWFAGTSLGKFRGSGIPFYIDMLLRDGSSGNVINVINVGFHMAEIIYNVKTGTIENRALGGSKVLGILSNKAKLRSVLVDSVNRFYCIVFFDEIVKDFSDKNAIRFFDSYAVPVADEAFRDERRRSRYSELINPGGIFYSAKPVVRVYDSFKKRKRVTTIDD